MASLEGGEAAIALAAEPACVAAPALDAASPHVEPILLRLCQVAETRARKQMMGLQAEGPAGVRGEEQRVLKNYDSSDRENDDDQALSTADDFMRKCHDAVNAGNFYSTILKMGTLYVGGLGGVG